MPLQLSSPVTARLETAANLRLSPGMWTVRWVLLVLLGGLVPMSFGLFGAHLGDPAYVLCLSLLVLSAWRLAAIVTHPRPALVQLTFWIFVYVWCALGPLSQMFPEAWPMSGQYSQADRTRAAVLTALGVGAWVVGYAVVSRRRPEPVVRTVDLRRVRYLGLSGLLIGGLAVAALGFGTFFSSRAELQQAVDRFVGGGLAQGQLFMGAVVVPPSLALFLLLWGENAAGWVLTSSTRVLKWALVAVVLVVANPISNSRYLSGSILIALLIARSPNVRTRRFTRQMAAAILAAVLILFPVADAARFADSVVDLRVRFDRELFEGGDYDAFQQTMNGARFVDDGGTTQGTQLLGSALFWVPRQAWPTKPEPTGVVVARSAGYSFLNLSSPIWVEGYVDFLWSGVVVFGLLLGALAGRLDRAYYEDRFTVWTAVASVYVGYQIIVLRGSLMGVIPFLALWAAISMVMSRRARPGRTP